jgi:hypothetical protein
VKEIIENSFLNIKYGGLAQYYFNMDISGCKLVRKKNRKITAEWYYNKL